MTDKYTRDFSNFQGYPWPGKNMPEYYDWMVDAGDGSAGLQWMIHQAMSAYGPRHVISGMQVSIENATGITIEAGYYMYDGQIKSTPKITGSTSTTDLDSTSLYGLIDSAGAFQISGTAAAALNSGLVIARRDAGDAYDISQRWDNNKITNLWVDRINASQITGTTFKLDDLSYSTISGSQITGTEALIGTIDNAGSAIDIIDNVDMNSNDFQNINDLDVNGDIDCEGGLDVNGYTNIDNTSVTGTFDVLGNTELIGTVDIVGNTEFTGTVGISSATIIQGNTQITGTLGVSSNILIAGTGTVDGVDVSVHAADEDAHHTKQHAMDSATYHTSSDIATLDATTAKHGFLKKLDNDDENYMDGEGNGSVPFAGDSRTVRYNASPIPSNGFTAGANNVYALGGWYGGSYCFGTNAEDVNYLSINFYLPTHYVLGTDVGIQFKSYDSNSGWNTIRHNYSYGSWDVAETSTFDKVGQEGLNVNSTAGFKVENHSISLLNSECNFERGDVVVFRITMDTGVAMFYTFGWTFSYQVEKIEGS